MSIIADINKLVLIGRLTRDCEIAYTTGGTMYCKCSLAFTRSIKRGEVYEPKSCFINFTLWGRRAESLNQYLKKGQRLALDGELDFDYWEQDGVKRSKAVIDVKTLQLLGHAPDGQGGSQAAEQKADPTPETGLYDEGTW